MPRGLHGHAAVREGHGKGRPASGASGRRRRRLSTAWAAAVAFAVPAIAAVLAGPATGAPGGDEGPRPAVGEGLAGAPETREAGHADGCCGDLEAALLAARFAHATRIPTRRHDVHVLRRPGFAPQLVVRDEALLVLDPAARIEELAGRHGLEVVRAVPDLAVFAVRREGTTVEGLLAELEGAPGVLSAEPHGVAVTAFRPNDELYPLQPGARGIDIEAAWDRTKGDPSVVVAVLDTGVDFAHPDLAGALLPGIDIVNGGAGGAGPGPRDDNGHGTAVAGIIAARGDNRHGIAGVAFRTTVLPVKVADGNGRATFADLVAGLDYAARQQAPIINVSLGSTIDSPALRLAVDRAIASRAVVIASAGNENVNHPMYPAAYPGVIAVGSSGNGPEVGFSTVLAPGLATLAPGELVVAPVPGGAYAYVGGTSAASAHVAGIAALARALNPALGGPQLAQALRQGVDPIPALAPVVETFAFGRINALKVLQRADPLYTDIAVTGIVVTPRVPNPGQAPTVRVRVENQGNGPTSAGVLRLRYDSGARMVQVGEVAVPAMAIGERRTLALAWPAGMLPPPGAHDLEATVDAVAGETERADNVRRMRVRVDPRAEVDVGVATMAVRPDPSGTAVEVDAVVRNSGNRGTTAEVVFSADGTPAGNRSVPLAPGGETRVTFRWVAPAAAPERVTLEVLVRPQPGEVTPDDNAAQLIVKLGTATATPIGPLYQQSNGVDVILDAPDCVIAGRPYVPLQVFVPSKGDTSNDSFLRVRSCEVVARDRPERTAPGTTVYLDGAGGPPTTAAPGILLVDEMGQVATAGGGPDLNIFKDQDLKENGCHNIIRVPRQAIGVPATPTQLTTKYFDSAVQWEYHRRILWVFNITRSGTTRKVVSVDFLSSAFPALPGENRYYDAHVHTIAEWFFDSPINLFAPRKAYGGPLQMIAECAYAKGLIASPADVRDNVITTDHNCFYNVFGNPDHPDRRPPRGPSSPAASPAPGGGALSERERYREIFGAASGEELAVRQDNILFQLGITISLPLGAHMLHYRADHVEGPWHGGGWIPDPGSPSIDVVLEDVLRDSAQQNQTPLGNLHAFSYAAHPFGGFLGWNDDHLKVALGLDPNLRTRDHVHASPPAFVFKGLQLWNGRGARSLPSSAIDFEDLNPFTDPDWQRGNRNWDRQVQEGLVYWHRAIAELFAYGFVNEPDRKFPRKVFIAGGSDAHGDFNYDISRLATPLALQETYSVGSSPFGCVRTYVFADGQPGLTSGERGMAAYAAGISVLTDGPVLTFSIDADDRFDSALLKWRDGGGARGDADGRIGGGGALDGLGTALVRKGSEDVFFRYRYSLLPDLGANGGAIAAIKIYKDEPGNPNPTHTLRGFEEPAGRGSLAPAAPDTDLVERIDAAEEGTVTVPAAFSLGAFTDDDPQVAALPVDARRCYTNPIWALPVEMKVTASPQPGAARIEAGELAVEVRFPITMDTSGATAEVKPLDAGGDSTDATQPAAATLAATWSAQPGLQDSVLTLVNTTAIDLGGAEYPASSGDVSFVVYLRDPRDMSGNALNPIAVTFRAPKSPGSTGTTSSPTTPGAGPGGFGGGGGGGGGGGCTLGAPVGATPWSLAPILGLLAGLALARRRRSPR